jgi:hypothetical protein
VKEAFAEESLGRILYPPDEVLARLPFLNLNDDEVNRVRNGLDIKVEGQEWADGERVRMRDPNQNLLAVGVFNAAKESLHPAVVIISEEP